MNEFNSFLWSRRHASSILSLHQNALHKCLPRSLHLTLAIRMTSMSNHSCECHVLEMLNAVRYKQWSLNQVVDFLKSKLSPLIQLLPPELIQYIVELATGCKLNEWTTYNRIYLTPILRTLMGKEVFNAYILALYDIKKIRKQVVSLVTHIQVIIDAIKLYAKPGHTHPSPVENILQNFTARIMRHDVCILMLHIDESTCLSKYVTNRVLHHVPFDVTHITFHNNIMAFRCRNNPVPFESYSEDYIELNNQERRVIRYISNEAFYNHQIYQFDIREEKFTAQIR